jgi:hypothetical protein
VNHVGRQNWCSWLVAGVLAASGLGCSDDDDGDDGNQGGSAGSGGASSSGGLSGPDEVPACRSSEPADPGTTFTTLAGEHPFTTETACNVDGVAFAANEAHRAVVVADARRIDVIPAGMASGLSYTWDGTRDLACKGEYTEYLEIDGHGRYIRLGFVTGKPSFVLFGLCIGDLSP